MRVQEAIEASHSIYVGVQGRVVKRRDRRGRLWFLISVRGRYFMVRPDKKAYREVSAAFAEHWDDWQPQTDHEARRESAFMNGPSGLKLRNVILGLAMGPLPRNMTVPSHLPEDLVAP